MNEGRDDLYHLEVEIRNTPGLDVAERLLLRVEMAQAEQLRRIADRLDGFLSQPRWR